MKRTLFALLAILLSLLISAAIVEAVLRVIGYSPAYVNPLNTFHKGDKHLGWVGVPSFSARFKKKDFDVLISINEKGFRKIESPLQPASGARAVMFLGDSFTWGWGVKQGNVFTDILQNELGSGMKVINCGVNAYGTVQEWIVLRQQMPVEKPKLVGVMFYRNDFHDNVDGKGLRRPYCVVEGGKVILKNDPVARPLGGSPFARWSYAVSFLSYYANYFKEVTKQSEIIDQTEEDRTESLRPDVIQVMEHTLGEMKTLCDSNGAKLFVVYVPPAGDMKRADASVALSGMKEICGRLQLDLLDPVEFMKAVQPEMGAHGEPLYYTHDGHWTAQGHRLAALFIRDYIRKVSP